MTRYSIELKTRKYVKGYGFLSFAKNIENKYWIKDQIVPKKVIYKAGESIGNKIADAVTKLSQNDYNNERQEHVEE